MAKDSSPFGASTAEAMSRLQGNVRKAFTGYYRTKDFIRRVRSCKTASDERTLVAKESAAIRNSFKGATVGREQRYHSLSKLVYIYLLGYPAIFGQVECMKLAASVPKSSHSEDGNGSGTSGTRIKDKRLGYLGVTLLSDEHQETLTLVTNSLKFDLNSEDESVKALALNSLTLLASTGMARELATEVEILLSAPSSNIRKKAVACATKLIQKDSDLIEIFEARLSALLSDKNHSVQLGALQLFQTILACPDYSFNPTHVKLLPSLLRILQVLQTAPLDTEFDISGVSDPLLQISLLRTIRQLVKMAHEDDSAAFLDNLNDLLAQLATTLDSSKNVGNAVLYEVVLTIMSLPRQDQSLVNLAIGTLGKFLSGNSCGDNNLRYVALNLLTRILNGKQVAPGTISSIQKHQSTILACLHDADLTIRKKAADLLLLLITNVSDLSEITLALLELCARDHENDCKNEILENLSRAILKYSARDSVLFLNLYIKLLKQVDSGHAMINEIVTEFISKSLTRCNSIQVVRELFFALTILEEPTQVDQPVEDEEIEAFSSTCSLVEKPKIKLPSDALLQVAFWYFGEFGQVLPVESLCTAPELIDLLSAFALNPKRPLTASYALNALAKLSVRLDDHIEVIKVALKDAALFYQRTGQFSLMDRARELFTLVQNEKIRTIALEPIKYETIEETASTGDNPNESQESLEPPEASASKEAFSNLRIEEPLLKLNHLHVFIDQVQVTSPTSLQLQLFFKSPSSPLQNVSIALAVSRGFDFDYLAPASSTEIDESTDRISLSIVLRKLAGETTDLLDFSDGPGETVPVDWNRECTLKIKVTYQTEAGGEIIQQISQLPRLINQ